MFLFLELFNLKYVNDKIIEKKQSPELNLFKSIQLRPQEAVWQNPIFFHILQTDWRKYKVWFILKSHIKILQITFALIVLFYFLYYLILEQNQLMTLNFDQ